ncbi:MAG: hypothetical protein JW934_11765 [Anaerolineae bacterium]|nr:hypothetical protein [Anaerolineae bacterium]
MRFDLPQPRRVGIPSCRCGTFDLPNWPLADSLWRAGCGIIEAQEALTTIPMGAMRIAAEMHVAERTVRGYLTAAAEKLRATSWAHAVALAMRKKVIV